VTFQFHPRCSFFPPMAAMRLCNLNFHPEKLQKIPPPPPPLPSKSFASEKPNSARGRFISDCTLRLGSCCDVWRARSASPSLSPHRLALAGFEAANNFLLSSISRLVSAALELNLISNSNLIFGHKSSLIFYATHE
jgi:hypothetical protein